MANHSDDGIRRRDFLNGVLLAAGGAAVSAFTPFRAFADTGTVFPCDGPIGQDPRVTRGGNVRATFNIGHWLRDGRLTFAGNTVKIAQSRCDEFEGTHRIDDDSSRYDVIIVGAGMSGASAAFFLGQQRPGTRILILDGQATPGGNANRDDAQPRLRDLASTATAYAVAPYTDFLSQIYDTTGIKWADHPVASPFYSYFFDDRTPYALPARSWNLDTYGAGLANVPYPAPIVKDLLSARDTFINWLNTTGSPTDPADLSSPEFDYLSGLTLDEYLTSKSYLGLHPAVSDFYTRYAVDALAGTAKQVSAYTSVSFIGAEYGPLFAYPGGNSAMLRHIVKWLVPASIKGTSDAEIVQNPFDLDALDRPGSPVRIRQGSLVLRGDTSDKSASVVYFRDGKFCRATAKAVIFAGQAHTARTACAHLFAQPQADAFDQVTLGPVVVANVALRRAAPVVDLGYDAYFWGSKYWADFVVADWTAPNRADPERPTVLTVYGGNDLPVDAMPQARIDLLKTPFSSYESSLREDLSRVLAGRGFDFDRDVTAVYLYRWGHSMVFPKPGWPFGPPRNVGGQIVRTNSPRHVARAQVGRISFGAQDVESSPANESAIGAGVRTAAEALALL